MKTIHTKYYKHLLNIFDTHILSTKSLKNGNHYTGQVQEFLWYLEQEKVMDLVDAKEQVMKDYYGYLITRPKLRGKGKLSPRTVNDNMSTLRLFSIRMQDGGYIPKGLKVPSFIKIEYNSNNAYGGTRDVLTKEEMRLVRSECKTHIEKCIIALAYGCGLRRSELENLNESDINYSKGMVTVRWGKNNKTRTVPISDAFLNVLKEFSYYRIDILVKTGKRTKSFFINDKGKQVKGHRLNEKLKVVVTRTSDQAILEKRITLHSLRHGIATDLLDAGNTFEYVRGFLGHALIDTTSLYAKRRKQKNYYQI